MKNQDQDSKVVMGSIVAGLVGIGAFAVYLACKKRENSLDHIGKVMGNVGDILESHHIDEPSAIKDFDKKLHKNENSVGAVVDWIATGISLWKKFKS